MASFSRRRFVHALSGAAALAAIPRSGQTADYPSRPIRLVLPYGAGGAGDQIGRPWVDKMSSLLGPTFVEYIGGAGGAIGAATVAREEPDGYSLLLGNGSTQVIIPLTSKNPGYSVDDFRAIYRLISTALVFAVHPSVPAADLRELIAYARDNPGKLSYGTPGIGTGNHLVGESFKQQAGALDIVHVPYRGISQATNDLAGGQISLVIGVMSDQLKQLGEAGKVRLLAVTSEKRLSGAPEIRPRSNSACRISAMRAGRHLRTQAHRRCDHRPDRTGDAGRDGRSGDAGKLPCPGHRARHRFRVPDKFQRIIDVTTASLAPVIKSIGLSNL